MVRGSALIVVITVAFVTVSAQVQRPLFRSGTELVLVNVVVRHRNGSVVRGLTRDDFSITEDDKPQTISSFDFEELDTAVEPPAAPDVQLVLPDRTA